MESLARISSLVESARDLTIDAAQAARISARSSKPLDRSQVKKLLDSRNEREVLDGLRRVIGMMYRSQKTLPFFSSVVKNVASPNLEIKKHVYIYLLHHAEAEPDLALLSINTIQKSLSEPNAHVRALALRTISGIRVPVISQIVSLAIKKGVADMSPHVRRAAALAIPKCFRLDPSQLPVLTDNLRALLADRQYFVAGAAVAAFEEVCPERIDLVHPVYRGLVKRLVDMDEWSQLATLRMLARYARLCFPRRKRNRGSDAAAAATRTADDGLGGFYGEVEGEDGPLDPDLELFLNGIVPLLQSRNSAVVVAVARSLEALGTASHVDQAIGPLVALMRGPQDIRQVALHNIVSVCLARPSAFVPYARHFLVRASDPPPVWELKFEALALVFPHAPARTKSLILHEFEHFARGGAGPALVREAVRAIGRCAQAGAGRATSARCLRLLLGQIASPDGTLAGESLTVIRHLIQLDPASHVGTVVRLAKNLDSATDPQARATIIWLVGEFSGQGGEDNVAPDVLRLLLGDFASEPEAARQQIVLLAARVYLHHINRQSKAAKAGGEGGGEDEVKGDDDGEGNPATKPKDDHPIAKLWEYVLHLVRYDTSYDLRDRARMYCALMAVPELATLALLAPKPAPQAPSPSEAKKGLVLGSASMVLAGGGGLQGIRGYGPLPDWVEEGKEPDPRLRGGDEEGDSAGTGTGQSSFGVAGGSGRSRAVTRDMVSLGSAGAGAGAGAAAETGVGAKTLDDWLAEDAVEEGGRAKGRQTQAETEDASDEEEEESDDEDDEEEEDDSDDDDDEEGEEEEDDEDEESGGEEDGLVKT